MRIVAGRHRGRQIMAPPGTEVRPTADRARQALFDILQTRPPGIVGAVFLDLFAGTAANALEALSRGAARAIAVEIDPAVARIAGANAATLDERASLTLLRRDATQLGKADRLCDIAFLDPPWGKGLEEPALRSLREGGWIGPASIVVLECDARGPTIDAEGYRIEEERRYGAARFVFLRLAETAS